MMNIKTAESCVKTFNFKSILQRNAQNTFGKNLKSDVFDFSGKASDFTYLKEEAKEGTGRIQNYLKNKFATRIKYNAMNDEALISKLKSETFRDFGGTYSRFTKEEINGLLNLCNTDKDMVLYLVDKKGPHYLKSIPEKGRFYYEEIESLVKFSKQDKPLLKELVNAEAAVESGKKRPLYNFTEIQKFMKFAEFDKDTLQKLRKMEISNDIIKNIADLIETNPKNYRDILESGVIGLIKEGKVSEDILSGVGKHRFLSNRVLNDIQKIRDNKPAVKVLPETAALNEIPKHVKNGEVCELKGRIYINDNGNPVKINLTKEKFEELFPLLDSAYTQQGNIGNCGLVSAMDNLMDKPKGKAAVYKLLRQDGNDIIVKFKNTKQEIRFKNGELFDTKDRTAQGAKGLQYIEQAFAIHKNNHYTKGSLETDALKVLSSGKNLISELEGCQPGEIYDAIVATELSLKNILKVVCDGIRQEIKVKFKPAGHFKEYSNDKNYIVQFHMEGKKSAKGYKYTEELLDNEYNLYSTHAYSVKGYNKEKGNVYVSNPWGTEIISEVPVNNILEYLSQIASMKLNV